MFSSSFATLAPYLTVGTIRIKGSAASLSEALAEVRFDPRVVQLTSRDAFLSHHRDVLRLDVDAVPSDSGLLTMRLPHLVESRPGPIETTVSLPLAMRDLYPHEDVGPAMPTTASLRSSDTSRVIATAGGSPGKSSGGRAWGAEITAVWSDIAVDTEHTYSYPAFIRLDSVGPGPVPVHSEVTLVADPNLVGLTLTSAFVGDTPAKGSRSAPSVSAEELSDGVTRVVLFEALAAGKSLSLAIDAVAAASPVSARELTYSRCTFQGPGDPDLFQRCTGLETATALSASAHPRDPAAISGTN